MSFICISERRRRIYRQLLWKERKGSHGLATARMGVRAEGRVLLTPPLTAARPGNTRGSRTLHTPRVHATTTRILIDAVTNGLTRHYSAYLTSEKRSSHLEQTRSCSLIGSGTDRYKILISRLKELYRFQIFPIRDYRLSFRIRDLVYSYMRRRGLWYTICECIYLNLNTWYCISELYPKHP